MELLLRVLRRPEKNPGSRDPLSVVDISSLWASWDGWSALGGFD